MSESTGLLNGYPVKFTYRPPPSDGFKNSLDDSQSGLSIHSEDDKLSFTIPNYELIALLEQEGGQGNKQYRLLFSGESLQAGKGSEVQVIDSIPNYSPGKLQLTSPPQELINSLLYRPEKNVPEWLDVSGGKSELTVIISTGGGGGGKSKAENLYQNVVRPVLKDIGFFECISGLPDTPGNLSARYNVIYTTSQDSIKNFISHKFPNQEQPELLPSTVKQLKPNQTILLLSGDTSLFELLNALPTPLPPSSPTLHLCLLPTGTGNALCSSIYLQHHPLSSLLLGSPHNLPLFHATFSPSSLLLSQSGNKTPVPSSGFYGAVVLSWAFHASLVADSDSQAYRQKYPGTSRFQAAARENLTPEPHLYNGRISVQRSTFKTDSANSTPWEDLQQNNPSTPQPQASQGYWYFLATLVSRLESTFLINPLSTPLSPTLRIIHFSKLPTPLGAPPEIPNTLGAKSIIQAMEAAYDGGKHVELPGVGYERDGVERVRVVVEEEDYVPNRERKDGPHEDKDQDGNGNGMEKIDTERGPERWRRICIDGAVVEVEKGGWVEVKRVPEGLEGVNIIWRGGK